MQLSLVIYALFFFRSKIIWTVQIVLNGYKLFLDTFGPIQNDVETSRIIWTRLKQFGRSRIVLCFDKAFARSTKIYTNTF